nr:MULTISPECIES: hypothetical protein [Vibrio]
MDHVVKFLFASDSIEIILSIDTLPNLHIGIEGKTGYAECFVSVQEFHRIKRELCDYMGIDEPTALVD